MKLKIGDKVRVIHSDKLREWEKQFKGINTNAILTVARLYSGTSIRCSNGWAYNIEDLEKITEESLEVE